jgi:hypothetical protein
LEAVRSLDAALLLDPPAPLEGGVLHHLINQELDFTTVEALWERFRAHCHWPDDEVAAQARAVWFCACMSMFGEMIDYLRGPDECPDVAAKGRAWMTEFERFKRETFGDAAV